MYRNASLTTLLPPIGEEKPANLLNHPRLHPGHFRENTRRQFSAATPRPNPDEDHISTNDDASNSTGIVFVSLKTVCLRIESLLS